MRGRIERGKKKKGKKKGRRETQRFPIFEMAPPEELREKEGRKTRQRNAELKRKKTEEEGEKKETRIPCPSTIFPLSSTL